MSQANNDTSRVTHRASSRMVFGGYPWHPECMSESCASGEDGAAGERALLSRAACCELLKSARLRALQ
jgi:hypothetical protein